MSDMKENFSMRHGWVWIWIIWVMAMLPACSKSEPNSPEKLQAPAATSAAVEAADARPAAPAPQAPLPAAIVAFRERRDACDHFRGEDAYDAKRAAFLSAEIAKACAGTDKALEDLRQRHAGNARALAALKDYEDKVE